MGKANVTFVLLNLAISAAVITFGVFRFLEKEVMKATALELESTVRQVAANLKWAETVPWELEEDRKQLQFVLAQAVEVGDLSGLDATLQDLGRFANQRQAQLNLRYNELVSTENTLAQTRQTLAQRTQELRTAERQREDVTARLNKARYDLRETRKNVAIENRTKQGLENTIESKNDQITDLNNTLASLEIDLETRIQERDNAVARYERCRLGGDADQAENSKEVRGTRGKILAVNNDWEYVVINRGMINNMSPDLIALVHRGNEYIAKIQVKSVQDEIAVAKIVPDSSVVGNNLVPGDTFFF